MVCEIRDRTRCKLAYAHSHTRERTHTHTRARVRTESAICLPHSEGPGRAHGRMLTVTDYVAGEGGEQYKCGHYLLHYVF